MAGEIAVAGGLRLLDHDHDLLRHVAAGLEV
jgi:hypothetical protein